MNNLPRLLIDGNSMVLRTGETHLHGIGRTTLELAKALDDLNRDLMSITLLTQTFRGHIPASFSSHKVKNVLWPIGHRYNWLREKTSLFDWYAKHDLQHIPHNFAQVQHPEKTVITIHDAMFFSYPENFLCHEFSRNHIPALAEKTRAIVTCSNNSKADIVEYMGIAPEKVSVIPWGVDRSIFFKHDKSLLRQQLAKECDLNRPFFLSVSCNIGRKNTLAVLRAFKAVLKDNLEHDLVLIWSTPPKEYLQEFVSEIESGRIKFLKNTSNKLLGKLYSAATLTWFPSKYEGFGLPVLESMASGTPVVTCRNSSLVEVGGEAALYVEPDDIDTMADIMKSFDTISNQNYNTLCEKSLTQASQFTWEKTAQNYMKWYLAHC